MNAHYVGFSLYFSLIQGFAGRDELATDWPHRHICSVIFVFSAGTVAKCKLKSPFVSCTSLLGSRRALGQPDENA